MVKTIALSMYAKLAQAFVHCLSKLSSAVFPSVRRTSMEVSVPNLMFKKWCKHSDLHAVAVIKSMRNMWHFTSETIRKSQCTRRRPGAWSLSSHCLFTRILAQCLHDTNNMRTSGTKATFSKALNLMRNIWLCSSVKQKEGKHPSSIQGHTSFLPFVFWNWIKESCTQRHLLTVSNRQFCKVTHLVAFALYSKWWLADYCLPQESRQLFLLLSLLCVLLPSCLFLPHLIYFEFLRFFSSFLCTRTAFLQRLWDLLLCQLTAVEILVVAVDLIIVKKY